jgi:hypothetical protein
MEIYVNHRDRGAYRAIGSFLHKRGREIGDKR